VHKYDLLLRLPLALGLAHAASEVRLPRGSSGARPLPRARPVAVLAAVAVLGGAAPALGSLQPPGSFTALPGYWQEVAGHLDERARATGPAPARALVVPAASFGEYAWGGPRDEPLQPLADSPWVVRDAVPLGGPGVTRVLDVVEEVLRSGRGSPALAPFLARAGIGRLVVRNDLDPVRTGAVRPLVLHAALAGSPGLRRTASFGPPVGAGFGTGTEVVDAQLAAPYPAVEVYEVEQDVPALTTWERAGTQRVSGGPETVLPLLEHGLLDPTGAVRLAGEPSLAGEESELRTVTDGYRDREADLGRAADQRSATLGAGAVRRLDRPVADHLPVRGRAARTTAVLQGLRAVTASSSAADADALLVRGRDHVAAAAFDGDAATSWLTGGLRPAGEWVEARFAPTALTAVDVGPAAAAGPVGRPVRVRVSNGRRSVEVALGGGMTRVPLAGTTSRLRVTLLDVAGPGRQGFGTSGVEVVLRTVGGPLVAQRGLRLPADAAVSTGGRPAAAPLAVLLTAARRDRSGCVPLGDRPVCASSLPLGDEDSTVLDRTLTVDDPLLAGVAVAGRVRPGPEVDALLSRGQPVTASATSRAVPDAAGGPAGRRRPRPAHGLAGRPARPRSRPRAALAAAATGDRRAGPGRREPGGLPPAQRRRAGRRRGARDGGAAPRRHRGRPAGDRPLGARPLPAGAAAPVGRAGRRARAAPRRRDGAPSARPRGRPAAPAALTGGRRLPAVRSGAVPRGRRRPAPGDAGGDDGRGAARRRQRGRRALRRPARAGAGPSRLRMAATPTVSVTALALVDLARPPPASSDSRVERVVRWGSTERSVEVVPGPASFLVVHEAANDGWTARLDGQRLRPVRLDGWQQGFVLPSGGGRVELVFAPDRPYRAALAVGALLALGLLALALLPVRSRVELPAARVRSPARRRAGAVLALAALPLLAGPAGLVALVLVAALGQAGPSAAALGRRRRAGRGRGARRPRAVAGARAAGTARHGAVPRGRRGARRQPLAGRPGPRARSRSAGSSTSCSDAHATARLIGRTTASSRQKPPVNGAMPRPSKAAASTTRCSRNNP
jgi:arabinofuranan 3-O-arabinosyltransferase